MNREQEFKTLLGPHPLAPVLVAIARNESTFRDLPAKVIARGATVRGYWQLHSDVVSDFLRAVARAAPDQSPLSLEGQEAGPWSLPWQRDVAAWYLGAELPRILRARAPGVWATDAHVPWAWRVWAYVSGPARVSGHAVQHMGDIGRALRARGPGLEYTKNKLRYLGRVLTEVTREPSPVNSDGDVPADGDRALGALVVLGLLALLFLLL